MTTEQETFTTFEDEIFFQENQSMVAQQQNQQVAQQEQETAPVVLPKKKPKRFGWAFFLFFLFMGVAITASTELPFGVLGGIAFGFLSFVNPVHDKVLSLLGGKDHVKKLHAWEDSQDA